MPIAVFPGTIQVLAPGDAGWPAGLDRLRRPPAQVRVLGAPPPFAPAVAIVGTRFAESDACAFAAQLAAELAAAGRVVVSGGAHGIDAAAHRGALAAGGRTVAVLAHGFDQAYPRSHRDLFRQIARDGGSLLSERPDGAALHRTAFVQRNRLIAALADALVVVQAPHRSGALSTAAVGFTLGIPVFSVPSSPWNARGAGCLALLGRGARICTCSRDVLSVRPPTNVQQAAGPLEPPPGPAQAPSDCRGLFDGLDDDCRAVYGELGRRAQHPDELAVRLAWSVPRLHKALLELELKGLARDNGAGAYARTQTHQ